MASKKVKYSKELLRLDNIEEAEKYPNLLLKNKRREVKKISQVPASSVLERVKAFMPQMKAADDELKHLQATSQIDQLNIEKVDDTDKPVIEMNLELVEYEESDESDVETLNDNDTEDDSDSSVNFDEITEKNLKLSSRKCKSKNLIEEIQLKKEDS